MKRIWFISFDYISSDETGKRLHVRYNIVASGTKRRALNRAAQKVPKGSVK